MIGLNQLQQLWEVATDNRWVEFGFKFVLVIAVSAVMQLGLVLLNTSMTREFARWICGWLGLSLIFGSPIAAVFLGGWWWLLPPVALVVLALYTKVNYRDEGVPTTWVEVLGSFKWKRGGLDKIDTPDVAAAAEFLVRDGFLKPGADALAEGKFAKAREEFEALAGAGNAAAMNNLGVLHEAGLGVSPSKADALQWYRKAADAGLPIAKHNLAILIAADHLLDSAEHPDHRDRDFIEAYILFSSAASQGLRAARDGLRDLRRHMTAEQIEAAKKAAG